jgi:hypothetical protein
MDTAAAAVSTRRHDFASGHGILCAGLPRSGTASLAQALRTLGITNVHHATKVNDTTEFLAWGYAAWCSFPYLRRSRLFRPFYISTYDPLPPWSRGNWDRLIGHYEAVTDLGGLCAKEIFQAYPESRVILVERPVDSWVRSYRFITDHWLYGWHKLWLYTVASWVGLPQYIGIRDLQCGFLEAASAQEAREKLPELHQRHYAIMRELVPKDQLLDFRLQDGWEPLCKFLDVPVPDAPFPHVNERDELMRFRNAIFWDVLKRLLRRLSVLAMTAGILTAAFRAVASGQFHIHF